jgi:predicted DsbA family dithiol-disulfide isomerase
MKIALLSLALIACGAPQRSTLPADACRPMDDDDASRPWEERGYRISVPWFAPRRGAERPRVVVQEFSDFECPYCARAVPTMDRVLEQYGACVQLVWRNRPMRYHPHAELAARAALEIYRQRGDGAFWSFHDRLFADQEHLEREDLVRIAVEIGNVDMTAFESVLDGDGHLDVIEADREAIDRHEPRFGTPTFVVNGAIVHGAHPYEVFQAAIEEALRAQYEVSDE